MYQNVFPSAGGWLAHRPVSTASRLIIPFSSAACCSGGPGFSPENRKFPPELKSLGVLEQQWDLYMQKLEVDVQRYAPSGCAQCVYWTLAIISFFCCLLSAEGKYHRVMREWLEEFNKNVLVNNMYAKFQSNEVHSKDYHEIISWLAISLNEDDAKILREEPVVWNPKCCSNQIVPSCCQYICCCCGPKRFV